MRYTVFKYEQQSENKLMSLSEDLTWRGLIKDKTFKDVKWLDKPQTFYHGVDASADSLTIGNLAALLLARRLINSGWKAVLLVGGATSLIGDPGGKDKERPLKPRNEIQKNVEAIKSQVTQLFAGQPFSLADNYDWFSKLGYLDFLRDVGKHYSVTELIQRDFVADRLGKDGSGISYAEFSYSLIQGYDFWQLYKKHQVVLQIGGSDQWGNMLSGVPLVRKKETQEVHALSMPLVINKTTGKKFGKSEGGAVWLDPKKTSPHAFYQFWINSSDEDVQDYLKTFTLLPKDEIESLLREHGKDPSKRLAQKCLAKEVTKLVHGTKEVKKAQDSAQNLSSTSNSSLVSTKVSADSSLVDALVKSGLVSSKSDARRLINEGGIYLNNSSTSKLVLEETDFQNGKAIIRKGKKLSNSAVLELS